MPFDNMTLSSNSSSPQNAPCDAQSLNSFPVRVVKILLYSFILFCSLSGNALIIKIVHKREELKKTINYFIVNMAVSDFVFPLISIPVHLVETLNSSYQWSVDGSTGLTFCKLRSFLQSVSITVSTQSLVWIALDRFVAVVLPMKVHLVSSRFRLVAIAFTWLVAIVVNSPFLFVFQLVEHNNEIFCIADLKQAAFSFLNYLRIYTVLFQIAPLVVMTILYSVIAVTLRRQDNALHCTAVHQTNHRKRRAINMALCIIAAFYFCCLPMLLLFLLWEYDIDLSCSFSKVLWFVAHFTLFLSSAINPIICVTFVQSYRLGLKEIFNSCRRRRLINNHCEREEITLQEIRVTSWVADNPALNAI